MSESKEISKQTPIICLWCGCEAWIADGKGSKWCDCQRTEVQPTGFVSTPDGLWWPDGSYQSYQVCVDRLAKLLKFIPGQTFKLEDLIVSSGAEAALSSIATALFFKGLISGGRLREELSAAGASTPSFEIFNACRYLCDHVKTDESEAKHD